MHFFKSNLEFKYFFAICTRGQHCINFFREFEKRALEQSYTIPTIWWHRIIVTNKKLKGWNITPSHYVGQDLAGVWLD